MTFIGQFWGIPFLGNTKLLFDYQLYKGASLNSKLVIKPKQNKVPHNLKPYTSHTKSQKSTSKTL